VGVGWSIPDHCDVLGFKHPSGCACPNLSRFPINEIRVNITSIYFHVVQCNEKPSQGLGCNGPSFHDPNAEIEQSDETGLAR